MKAIQIPRSPDNDYTQQAAAERRQFIEQQSGASLHHVGQYSFDPGSLPGNIENFTGIVQMPLGFAGPVRVNGEHAQGDFFVPMATTEGTLVASYSRGMKLTREAGGITTTVVDDAMQRSPVYVFENARQARDFAHWLLTRFSDIKAAAETTTSVGKLRNIEQYPASKMIYLRFNYTTGDAAGQNMCGKATYAACQWINAHYKGPISRYFLSGNMDTDKKHSQLNTLHSRGKRVIAEITLPRTLLQERMRTTPEAMYAARMASQLGGLMAGAVHNGVHPANGIASVFIATGQDEANVAESHASLVYAEITPEGDYYYSVTLPSLIVATYGGGTGLATQRECLETMDCYGAGKAHKLAEIIAATVLCGEISLGAAVVSEEWVSSHDELGRNRP
ncbi:hydroxymethylglutaryl-CoA reductase [Seongchinamella sediminis]|uniref:hydroxymethylglutaryl-CoA reductase (NADPH) n=1 Tax=Seongchinamella sediminis TaxID=2283635 RepID=A0A3L7DWJ8_9GAMM|nr:hydroxymethylglutaryl-CoA reductase [Seongchinamella sediminis]RLQ20172.1 hydroxymethylglutaryl-CoA reductase [Seongchinamella sediminis]